MNNILWLFQSASLQLNWIIIRKWHIVFQAVGSNQLLIRRLSIGNETLFKFGVQTPKLYRVSTFPEGKDPHIDIWLDIDPTLAHQISV